MNAKNLVYLITLTVLVIGGINWGLVGLFGFDLVAFLFGNLSILARIVYVLVGVSAIYIAIAAAIAQTMGNSGNLRNK